MYEVVYNAHTYIILTFLRLPAACGILGSELFLVSDGVTLRASSRGRQGSQAPWSPSPHRVASARNSQPRNASPSLGCPVRSQGFVFNSSQHVIPRASVGVGGPPGPPRGDGCGPGTPAAAWRGRARVQEDRLAMIGSRRTLRLAGWSGSACLVPVIHLDSESSLGKVLLTVPLENASLPSLALTAYQVWLLISHQKF